MLLYIIICRFYVKAIIDTDGQKTAAGMPTRFTVPTSQQYLAQPGNMLGFLTFSDDECLYYDQCSNSDYKAYVGAFKSIPTPETNYKNYFFSANPSDCRYYSLSVTLAPSKYMLIKTPSSSLLYQPNDLHNRFTPHHEIAHVYSDNLKREAI